MAQQGLQQGRKCPGERYEITLAICRARQANHYPKCLLCKHYAGETTEDTATDPKVGAGIFRTSSIAGHVPSEINEYVIRKVGTAAAQFLRAESAGLSAMAAGYDLRKGSRNLCRIFCEGASQGGLNTISVGPATPEIVRFAQEANGLGGAAFISGCHGPESFNGVRLYSQDGAQLTFRTGLDKISLIARKTKPGRTRAQGQRNMLDPRSSYRSYVLKFAPNLAAFRIVVDCSRGIAGSIIPFLFDRLPVEVTLTHGEADGSPLLLGRRLPAAETQSAVESAIRAGRARMGAAIDFDGDIIAFFDETGALVRSDVAAALIAGELLHRTPRARIAYDLRFTGAVREQILKAGGQTLATPADPLVLANATLQKDALYAADIAGRHFFRDLSGAESPVLALLLMCSLLSRTDERLSRLASEVARYSHSGELRYDMPSPEAAAEAIEEMAGEFRDGKHDTMDGLTVHLPTWWFNVRHTVGSSTLKLVVEGRTRSDERRGRAALERIVKARQRQAGA